jgi:glycerophosphoryl diester phosphodiesterase
VTKDGVIVLSHDPVDRLTAAEAGAPTLDEALTWADGGPFELDLEIKSYGEMPAELARMTLEKIRAHGMEPQAIVSSFDFQVLIEMRKLAPEIRLAALIANDERDFTQVSQAAASAEIVAPQFRLATLEKVAAAHAAGLRVFAWTANTPRDWDRLIAAGVDAIIADDPRELTAHLRA